MPESLFFIPLIIFIVLSAAVLLGEDVANFIGRKRARARNKHVPSGTPVVGYKRAFLNHHEPQPFCGVGGNRRYGMNEDKAPHSLGFHIYYTPDQAYQHSQAGSVFLEVVGSGTIDTHEKGIIATHQRVLQVIVGSCDRCSRQATKLTMLADSRGEKNVYGVCDWHGKGHRTFSFDVLKKRLTAHAGYTVPVGPRQATSDHYAYIPTKFESRVSA